MKYSYTVAEKIETELQGQFDKVKYIEVYDGKEIVIFEDWTFHLTINYEHRKDWQWHKLQEKRAFLTDCYTMLFDTTLYHVKTDYAHRKALECIFAYHKGLKNGNLSVYRLD